MVEEQEIYRDFRVIWVMHNTQAANRETEGEHAWNGIIRHTIVFKIVFWTKVTTKEMPGNKATLN
jgi:hypothetical protein